MHCGCPLPGETIGQRLSRLVGITIRHHPSFLLPPDTDNALLAGTHPSDHNAVIAFRHKGNSKALRKKRAAKIAARRKRDAESTSPCTITHDPFLAPVPIYFDDAACFASAGVVNVGGCAVVSSSPSFTGAVVGTHVPLVGSGRLWCWSGPQRMWSRWR